MVDRRRDDVRGPPRGLRRGAGDEQRLALRDDALRDCRNLRRRLAQAEHDFREALPHGPMRVDARKAQVLERRRRASSDARGRAAIADWRSSGAHLFEKRVRSS